MDCLRLWTHAVSVPSSVIPTLKKRRIHMKRNSRIRGSQVLAAALLMSLFFIATSQAQTDLPVFAGKFTLTDQVQWGKTVLQPGDSCAGQGQQRSRRCRVHQRNRQWKDKCQERTAHQGKGWTDARVFPGTSQSGKGAGLRPSLGPSSRSGRARSPDSACAVGRTVGEAAIDRTLGGSVAGLPCPLTVH
jgi:hypothetical protein